MGRLIIWKRDNVRMTVLDGVSNEDADRAARDWRSGGLVSVRYVAKSDHGSVPALWQTNNPKQISGFSFEVTP